MKVTSKGQVTIPKPLRDRLGLHADTEVEFELSGNAVKVKRAKRNRRKDDDLVAWLKGRGNARLTTDEIMKLTRG